jgi:hypothetical protein
MGLSVLGKAASLCGRTERWLVRKPPRRVASPKVKSKKITPTSPPATSEVWLVMRVDARPCIMPPMFAAVG